ncbi:enoyl-CoA hydratase/isomerase family protein [Streptomyces kroppenstedtii]|uniref:enoyl-CoA hydratase/isomerase family protein n=1 Tax=Streptomyces kroppenstedtii TaxID=3051181 RepID=UPI0028D0D578|nr:enoyl-CoA hydratase/isomerase family protein [Streptomyces sp. DSM 40484]
MPLDGFSTLHTDLDGGVLTITLDNPPVNALSATMMRELRDLLTGLRSETTVKVIVVQSGIPEFFIAHVDMDILAQADVFADLAASAPAGLNVFQSVSELLRTQPQVTIVKLAGTARGGGAEFVAAADLAFAATETAGLGQIEALMGITPGGGATQYLLEKVGRNRALELVLTGERIDATTAAAYGWINRAVPAADLDAFVHQVAHRIAALADGVVTAAKRALPLQDHAAGFRTEHLAWAELVERPAARQLMAGATRRGAQTVGGERDLEGLLRSVAAQQA